MNFDQIKRVHFVGIGGIGMSGLAELLASRGIAVSGCDARVSSTTELLESHGIRVDIGHDASHIKDLDLVVATSAMRADHPELARVRELEVPLMKRAELLGAISNAGRGVGIAGTHGKTSTSAMTATLLEAAGLDPTVIVGGMLRNFATNARIGRGDFVVVEADEYDRSFHQLHPELAVITNIEPDHLEYYGSIEAIEESFAQYVEGIAPGGVLIGCADDPRVAALMQRSSVRTVGYGLDEGADLRARSILFSDRGSSFEVIRDGDPIGFFKLFVPGEHNIRNALAAIAVALELRVNPQAIASGLARYLGVDRRFQILGEYHGAIIVDDYAHHPTEIRATLNAARRGYPDRRLVALFQPHLYSRTRDFARDFAEALLLADVPLVSPIYAAREEPLPGVTAHLIADAAAEIGSDGIQLIELPNDGITAQIRTMLQPNDLFITMGAGDINTIAKSLIEVGR
jgi:UDP-N-acetylmuramate--alanine ligase